MARDRRRVVAVAVLVSALFFTLLLVSEHQRRSAAMATFREEAQRSALLVEEWFEGHLNLQRAIAFQVGGADPEQFREILNATYADFALLLDIDGRVIAAFPDRHDLVAGDDVAGAFPHIDAVLTGEPVGFWATDQAANPTGVAMATAVPVGSGGGVLSMAFEPNDTTLPSLLQAANAGVDNLQVVLTEAGTGVEVLAPVAGLDGMETIEVALLDGAWELMIGAPSTSVGDLVGGTTNVPGRIAVVLVVCLLTIAVLVVPRLRARIHTSRRLAAEADQLFDVAATPAVLMDPDHRITRVNRALQSMTGYTEEELVGQHAARALLHPDDIDETAMRELAEQERRGDPAPMLVAREHRFRTRDGTDRYGRITGVPITDERGRTVGILGQIIDLTDIEQARAALQESRDELRHFSYRVAHDLVGPLSAQRGLAELLTRADLGEEQRTQVAERIVQSAQAAAEMVRELLGRAERLGGEGRTRLDLRQVHDWLERMVTTELAETAGSVDLDTSVTHFEGPEGTLRTVLLNLVGNSLKYSRPDVPPRITITAEPDGDHMQFAVIDNGKGVSEDALERIFLRGERADGDADGHGSGLAECRRLLTIAGGRIWAERGAESGLVVRFVLPRMTEGADPSGNASMTPERTGKHAT